MEAPVLFYRPLIFTWPYAALFWLVWAWAIVPDVRLVREARRAQAALLPAERDPSFNLLVHGQRVVVLLAVAVAFLGPGGALALRFQPGAFWSGLVCVALGALLRRHCFRLLGTDFQGAVTVRADQRIVAEGAYRLVRHPSYTAAILFHLGIGLALGHWWSLAIQLVGNGILYFHRMRVEERALVRTLGEPYLAYMRRTRRLIPYVL